MSAIDRAEQPISIQEESIPIDKTQELLKKHGVMAHAISPDLRTHDGKDTRLKLNDCVSLLKRMKQGHAKAIHQIEDLLHKLGE